MRIIFAGTPEISAAVLQALIDAKHNIIACLTQPDRPQGRGLHLTPSPVKVLATAHNIPVYQPQNLKGTEIQAQLQALNADVMVVIAYGLILPKVILNMPRLGCINIHASLLPRWRGAAPIQHAILAGDTATGITIMQMDAGLDTGDMLAIYPCAITEKTTTASLFQELTKLSQHAIVDSLDKLAKNELTAIPQDNARATYADKLSKQQAEITWSKTALEIDREIRAYNPWPVAYTRLNAITIRIWQACISNKTTNAAPGTIVALDKQGIHVATGTGVICLERLQLPGKKQLDANDIIHAHKEFAIGNALK